MSSFSFWQRLRRSPYQSIASVFMVYITVSIMALFLLLTVGSWAILRFFESKPQVTVYFKDEKTQASITELANRLKSSGYVSDVKYISKEEALAKYREDNKNDPLLLEMVTAEILPASLEVSAVSPERLSNIAQTLKQEQGVDEVVYLKDVVDSLVVWTNAIRKVGIIFVLSLVVETIIILLTIIGMRIALKRDEIEILRLVGATSWYIKRPFLAEGIIYGAVGSTFAWGTVCGLVLYFLPFIGSFLQGIPTLTLVHIGSFSLDIWPISWVSLVSLWIVLFFAGCLIGFIGSILAVSRYLSSGRAVH